MSDEAQYPLVTFALLAYNQEKYIREAVEGALAQDYPNLEIIISDDCSTDGTFDVIQRVVRSYDGPHQIVLNRNEANLHIGRHVSKVNSLSRGELVVAAAGDDISLPHRTRIIVEAWLRAGREPAVIHSMCKVLAPNGELLDYHPHPHVHFESIHEAAARNIQVIGASEAWDPKMFNLFGAFRDDLVNEDCALPFRSLLAGRPVLFIDQPLLHYRQSVGISHAHGGNAGRLDARERLVLLDRLRAVFLQKLQDLHRFDHPGLRVLVERGLARVEVALMFEGNGISVAEFIRASRVVGIPEVARLTGKRLWNAVLDRVQAG